MNARHIRPLMHGRCTCPEECTATHVHVLVSISWSIWYYSIHTKSTQRLLWQVCVWRGTHHYLVRQFHLNPHKVQMFTAHIVYIHVYNVRYQHVLHVRIMRELSFYITLDIIAMHACTSCMSRMHITRAIESWNKKTYLNGQGLLSTYIFYSTTPPPPIQICILYVHHVWIVSTDLLTNTRPQ